MPVSMTKEQKIKAMENWAALPESITCACKHVLIFLSSQLTGSKIRKRVRVDKSTNRTKVILGEAKRPDADVYLGSLMCWSCIKRLEKHR